jgi:hypothetical protein
MMKLMNRTIIALFALTAVGLAFMSKPASADTVCAPVHGTMTSTQTTAGCTSPTGICFTGSITGASLLDGSTSFVELDQAPSAGMPLTEPANNVSYSGTLTITTNTGDELTTRNLGVLDGGRLAFTELERPVGGTGVFAGSSHVFFISGSTNSTLTSFMGTLSGTLCTNRN